MMAKLQQSTRTEEEIRRLVHAYFFERYQTGRGERGKSGIAATISVIRSDLKVAHGLSQQEIARALMYLIDEGWVRRDDENKMFQTGGGTKRSSTTSYYRITSAGVTKIEGEGAYTMTKFHGINIEATGQNYITVGDGNQVNAKFEAVGNQLAKFKDTVLESEALSAADKLAVIADVDSIQAQLAKPDPNPTVFRTIWAGIEKLVTGTTLAANTATLATALSPAFG